MRSAAVRLALLLAAAACEQAGDARAGAGRGAGDGGRTGDGGRAGRGGPADAGPGPDAPARRDAPGAGGEWEEVVAEYGVLRTIAGAGRIRERGVNGWQAAFEGGPATEAELSRPHMAMADGPGNVYIADKDAHAVRRVSPGGVITTLAGTGEPGDDGDEPGPARERRLREPNGLHAALDGTVYVLDLGNGKVRRVDAAGTMTTLFAVPGGIAIGRGLWVREDEGLAYLSSGSRVLRWTPGSGVETAAEGFSDLGNLAVSPGGDLVVTDRGASRVYRVAADGAAVPIAGSGAPSGGGDGAPAAETGLAGVRGVAFRPAGGMFLATHEGSQVWFVDSAGVIHLFLDGASGAHAGDGERFDTPGAKVSEVRAVALAPSGDLLVTEHDAGYLRVVERAAGGR